MSIGDLATILTVAGVSIYVLGLIGLAIPIRREFTGDISTAWYAVSLVPKTVVAGQGARLWLGWPVAIAAVLYLLTVALRVFLPSSPFSASATFTFFWGMTVIAGLAILWLPAKRVGFRIESYHLLVLVLFVVGLELAVLSMAMLSYPKGVDLALKEFLPFMDWRDWASQVFDPPGSGPPVFRGIVVLFIGSFFLGLPFATSASAPLPKVRITKQPEDTSEGVAEPFEGWLVAHSDGFWHLFPQLPTDENEENRDFIRRDLISVPDDEAAVVRTFGEEVAPAKGSSEADGQRDAE